MKALMYHYVRPPSLGLDNFSYLHVENFKLQLDYIEQNYDFINRKKFEESIALGKTQPGVILTFDDGFSDHYNYVLPELIKKNIWGCFYITTSPLVNSKLLDVHRIHILIGKFGGEKCMALLEFLLEDHMLSHQHIEEFQSLTYNLQNNNEAVTIFKRTLNYFISYEWRQFILDNLMAKIFTKHEESELAENFYMTAYQIRAMANKGMLVGSHTVNHLLMSKLSIDEQRKEINESFDVLSNILDERVKSFCYPYGGFHSFTEDTECLLFEAGSMFAFNVESRDISDHDLKCRLQALPRYDCNEFLHGKASVGNNVKGFENDLPVLCK